MQTNPPSNAPARGAVDLDFTGTFKLEDLRQEPPPSAPASQAQRTLPNDILIGAKALAKDSYFVNFTRTRPARKPGQDKTMVLLVEDDEPTRNILNFMLTRSEGYLTRQAGDVTSFIAALQMKPTPDVVILDVELPGGVSGFKILEKIRAHPAIGDLPVILFTAHAEPQDLQRGLTLGVDGYLSKPAKAEAIFAALKTVLGHAPD